MERALSCRRAGDCERWWGTCAAPKLKPMPMLLNAVVAAGELNVAVDAGRPNIPPPVLAEPELLAATAASSVPAFAAAGAPNGEAAEPNAGAASAATIQPPLAVGAAPRRPPAAGVAAPEAGASALPKDEAAGATGWHFLSA